MQIVTVGGGPGGLYLSILLARQSAGHRITIFERDLADETFGWGVAFAENTLATLRESDPPTFDTLLRHAVIWSGIDVRHRGERVLVRSPAFAGIARQTLVGLLRRRALDLGVEIRFSANVRDVRTLPDADLVVGADGANSLVRRSFADGFGPTLRAGANKYVWLGIRHRLDALLLGVRRTAVGVFIAHGYPFAADQSSVVIECDEATWLRAGLDRRTDPDACSYLSDVFADELRGHLLQSNDRMNWRHFLLVENAHWHAGRVVLLGDALHTVHFSTGAGTRLALEDAVALAGALGSGTALDPALAAYEAARRPAAAADQAQARASLEWFEQTERLAGLAPVDLAYQSLIETRRVDPAQLAELDPEFLARVQSDSRP
jgi:anthraniloyl-CoA monooxygenase